MYAKQYEIIACERTDRRDTVIERERGRKLGEEMRNAGMEEEG